MTRLEAPNPEIKRDWVDLADIIRAAVARGQMAWPDRKVDLAIAPGLPLVHGDSGLLEQVVFNLLDNAHKYSPPGAPTKVSVVERNREIILEVSDEGGGIPPQDLERVFDKFYRVKHGDGRSAGVGLGLAICRGIVTALGGSITAASPIANDRGTRITIRIPVPAAKAE